MTDKHVLVEYRSGIEDLFKDTHRIKFTAFDVSKNYYIFGASSGGIYIFKREPCQFFKLIPSVHGPAILMSISEDEENLALAMETGLIIIIERFRNHTFDQRLYTQHDGQIVTVLKWHGNYLYCGDDNGKVSVITVINFVTVVMFHAPSCCLMNLESEIVQIDSYAKFLLISTQNRSLLCDTEMEQYRQIGKKLRDEKLGGCFFNKKHQSGHVASKKKNTSGGFKFLQDDEKFTLEPQNEVNIYCARPKARLWRADLQAEVVSTLCFKEALEKMEMTEVIQINQDEFSVQTTSNDKLDDQRFGKLFNLKDRFIFTFSKDKFVIFEPESGDSPIWCGHFDNLKDAKIVDEYIFIWHRDADLSILSLISVEDLIVNTLTKKQYQLCIEICKTYIDDVTKLVETSRNIHVMSVLERNIANVEDLAQLQAIFDRLKELSKTLSLAKLTNGIVDTKESEIKVTPPDSHPTTSSQTIVDILSEQFRLSRIDDKLESGRFMSLVKSFGWDEIYAGLEEFYGDVASKSSNDQFECRIWCQDSLLRLQSNSLEEIPNLNAKQLDSLSFSYLDSNRQSNLSCQCDFPLPRAHTIQPKYYELGRTLMELLNCCDLYTKSIPFMHKSLLERIDDSREIMLKLPLIIQFSDGELLEKLSVHMTYDIWDASIKLMIKLHLHSCLHCGGKIVSDCVLPWKSFALTMVRSINGKNAVELLKNYSNSIENGALDELFYQYCIFQTAACTGLDFGGGNVFAEMFKKDSKPFTKSVGGYLRKQYLRNHSSDDAGHHLPHSTESICDYCHLPLKIPVIDDVNKLDCGHIYHRVCLWHRQNKCCVCDAI